VIKDYSQTVMLPGDVRPEELDRRLAPMLERGLQELLAEGLDEQQIVLEPALDLRYRGQSYELTIPYTPDFIADFHRAHRARFGYERPVDEIDVVTLRLKAIGKVKAPDFDRQNVGILPGATPAPDYRRVYFGNTGQTQDGWHEIPCYQSHWLSPGIEIAGPALISCPDTTVLVGFGWLMVVGLFGDFLMVNGYAK
jgi:N-methylhydantoinase A/oxoprolinase/acetone carboxylase beta subunit